MNINNLVYLITYKENLKNGAGKIFEVVVPYLSSPRYKNNIDFPEETVDIEYRNGWVHRLDYKGNRFYNLEDFLRFEGDPQRQHDIDLHYALYKHGRIRIDEYGGCAYHYREIRTEENVYE